MRLLESKQRFGAVGQGLFHWGSLCLISSGAITRKFTYVFDCGSKPKAAPLQKEIDYFFAHETPSKELDLLIISHLDYDHVSGLDSLLKKTRARTVILPYLTPIERLLLFIQAPQNKRSYWDFLISPCLFLKKMEVKEIVYVTKGDKTQALSPPETVNEEGYDNPSFHININDMEDDPHTQKTAIAEDPADARHAIFKKDSLPSLLRPYWQFCFYVSLRPETQINQLRKYLSNTTHGISPTDILQNKEKRRIVANQYIRAFNTKDLNSTCLACLNGPLFSRSIPYYGPADSGLNHPFSAGPLWSLIGLPLLYCVHPSLQEENYKDLMREVNKRGLQYFFPDYTLLMGDLSAKQEWDRLMSKFQHYIKRVHIFQIPHHGSRSSWNDEISKNLIWAMFIISVGLNNRYGHPHQEVLRNLSDAGLAGNIRLVNELSPLTDYMLFPLSMSP